MNKFVDVSNLQQGTIFLALNNCIPKFILVTRYRIVAGMASTYNACPGSFRGHFVLARGVSLFSILLISLLAISDLFTDI